VRAYLATQPFILKAGEQSQLCRASLSNTRERSHALNPTTHLLPLLPPRCTQQQPDAVAIMDGAHEGAYAWLTLNYLLGKLDAGGLQATVAAIDLGGGSVQEAFALPPGDAAAAPAGYVTQLKAGGSTYSIYVHRCLCVLRGVFVLRAPMCRW
jgi:hypothetical protein